MQIVHPRMYVEPFGKMQKSKISYFDKQAAQFPASRPTLRDIRKWTAEYANGRCALAEEGGFSQLCMSPCRRSLNLRKHPHRHAPASHTTTTTTTTTTPAQSTLSIGR